MSLEEFLKIIQAMELVTADVAHIKNKDMEDLYKMCTTKQRGEAYFGGEKWHIQCPVWEKIFLNVKRKNHFSRECKNEQRESLSHRS